jgi:hypothetical protein
MGASIGRSEKFRHTFNIVNIYINVSFMLESIAQACGPVPGVGGRKERESGTASIFLLRVLELS